MRSALGISCGLASVPEPAPARFDNRDTGLSTHLTGMPAPGWLKAMLWPSAAPYRLDDMAEDALAVMDALGWPTTHLAGASMGGMIAQILAVRYPSRVRTLTSIMSTPSSRVATMSTIAAIRALAHHAGTPVADAEQAAEAAVALKRVTGSPGYPLDEPTVRDIGHRSFERDRGAEEDDARQRAAYLAYIALHSFVFTFQSTTLLKEWNGGGYSAFAKNPAAVDWSYALVNLLISAAGLGLVTLGSWLRARRRHPAPAPSEVSLAE